jgi:hypothetical protein
MRFWFAALICLFLGGCAASRQEVAARLGDEYVGKNVDMLVAQWGPPASMFRMNNGGASYQCQLSAVTDIDIDRGSGTAGTRACKVTVIAAPDGKVVQLNTEDPNAGRGIIGAMGGFGSMCAHRLGMRPQG